MTPYIYMGTLGLNELITVKPLNISHTLVGNNIVDNSDVVGAPPIILHLNTWLQRIGQKQLQDETRNILIFLDLVQPI